jgi:type VI secretion system protein ImpA
MPISADLLLPISGANPSGVLVWHDAIYEEIKEAHREEDDAYRQPGEAPPKKGDWPKVIKLATHILATRSKDLEIAGWMLEGLIRRDGIAGLREGLQLVKGLIDNFWDSLYPTIVSDDAEPFGPRVARLIWIGGGFLRPSVQRAALNRKGHGLLQWKESQDVGSEESCGGDEGKLAARQRKIAAGKMPAEEFDRAVVDTPKLWYKALTADLQASFELVAQIEAHCAELMPSVTGDDAPNFGPLKKELRAVELVAHELLDRKLKAEPDLVEATSGNGDGDGTAGDDPNVVAAPNEGGLPAEPRSLDDAASRLREVARYLRRQLPGDPGPYLMVRGLRWGELRRAGDPFDDHLLVAPSTAARVRIKTLALADRWSEVLEACEELMARPEGRGWLDLQRFAIRACDNLGGDFDAIGLAIRGQLSLLLRDLPTLPDKTMMDETPTANKETRDWLVEQQLVGRNGDEGSPELTTVAPSPPRVPRANDAVFERAREAARNGQPKRALEILTQEVARERNARSRFLRQTQMATVMVESGLDTLARPLLDELLSTINDHQLDRWETGELVAEPLALLYRVLTKLDIEEDLRRQIYLRICKLDPLQAMSLEG